MATHNDWIVSNIRERINDPTLDYKVKIVPYKFREYSFQDAADYTAKLIYEKHQKLYVALSGGADSEFVLRCFHRNNIPVTPILVRTSGNEEELSYAYDVCDELKYYDPVILDLSDSEYLTIYHQDVIKKLYGYGIYAIPSIVACRYAKEHDGILIIGEHLVEGEKPDKNGIVRIRPATNEWDCYNEAFVGYEYNIPFFMYTLELSYAMIKAINEFDVIDRWKCSLYQIKYRPIIEYKFSRPFTNVQMHVSKARYKTANPNFELGSKDSFLVMMNNYLDKENSNVG
jgi:hypothetical protein